MTGKMMRGLSAVVALSLIAACGNDADSKSSREMFKSLSQIVKPKTKAQPQAVSPDALGQVLAATPNSVVLFILDTTKAQAPLIQIERNGAYRTYATSARQTVTIKDGLATATRGLGGDLMSSDLDPSLNLVRRKSAGQTTRVMRFLTGEGVTFTMTFTCSVEVAAKQDQLQGMRESCTGRTRQFENTYAVDASGRIMGSRQWLGPTIGYASFALLRD